MIDNKGILFVLSGPSGVGKGTVRKEIFNRDNDLKYSISATTRDMREGEKNGVDYFFKSKTEFQKLIQENELLEYAKYVDNYYGTPREYVEEMLADGHDVFLEIEVQGALQVKNNFPSGVFIFLLPPSLEELKNRIVNRGTETTELVSNRLAEAKKEIRMMDNYDYAVLNDDINRAVACVESIIASEHLKRERVEKEYRKILEVELP